MYIVEIERYLSNSDEPFWYNICTRKATVHTVISWGVWFV
jgi:hypothetical protein